MKNEKCEKNIKENNAKDIGQFTNFGNQPRRWGPRWGSRGATPRPRAAGTSSAAMSLRAPAWLSSVKIAVVVAAGASSGGVPVAWLVGPFVTTAGAGGGEGVRGGSWSKKKMGWTPPNPQDVDTLGFKKILSGGGGLAPLPPPSSLSGARLFWTVGSLWYQCLPLPVSPLPAPPPCPRHPPAGSSPGGARRCPLSRGAPDPGS